MKFPYILIYSSFFSYWLPVPPNLLIHSGLTHASHQDPYVGAFWHSSSLDIMPVGKSYKYYITKRTCEKPQIINHL